jgi:hypothetical protein
MLCSYIPGRIRLRLKKRPDNLPDNLDASSWPGVRKLTSNPATGSFLLEYDPEVLALETIIEVVEHIDPEAALALKTILAGGSRYPSANPQPTSATAELINMGTALIASAVTGFYGPKKYHVHCGLFFCGLTLVHAWRYRRRIKPLSKWTIRDLLGLPAPPAEPVQPEDCYMTESDEATNT